MAHSIRFKRLAMHSVLALTLITGAAPIYTYAEGAISETHGTFDIPSIGSVKINDSSYFELTNVRLTSGSDQNLVSFTVKAVNGGASDIQFIDYWIRVQSSTGAKFTVNVVPQDKDKNIIPAGGSQEIQFSTQVTPSLNLSDLTFTVIKWDFSAADYQRTLGTLTVPSDYSTVTPANSKANIKISKTSFQAFVKKATISSNEENYLPTLLLELQNKDTRSLKLPAVKFMIRTADGLLYPLQANGVNENTTIDPLMKKEIALSGKLPRSISNDGWELVITEPTDTGSNNSSNVVVGEFSIPKATDEQLSTEKEQSFSNSDGSYIAKLEAIQRVPWEDDDLVIASLLLQSKENKSLPLPNLTGYIQLDNSVKVDVKVIQTDNIIGLQPNSEVRIQLLGSIPYTYDFSTLSIHLQEKVGGSDSSGKTNDTLNDLVQFKLDSKLDSVPLVNANEHYKIGGIGRSGDYTVHAFHNFKGKSSDIITAQVEVENLEKRANDLSKLVGHFKGSDGTVYPATLSEIKTKIGPSGKALLFVWASVAKNKGEDVTQLLLGEGITEGKYTKLDGKPDAYVSAVSFFLPQEKTSVQNSLKEIDIFPYTLNLKRVGTPVEDNLLKLKIEYELEKNMQYEVETSDYKLIMEIVDADGKATVEWALDIEKTKDGTIDPKSTLQLGSNKIELINNDKEFIYKVSYLKKMNLNIYQQFQGQKKLIASKGLDWFVYSE
ncbi:hypothetical protein [Paenibacillus oceani]|uniref:Uncharacterized protein n=1 Tax=Paenibacillus oceani TaxID=2772510 RepID=A0A927CCV9_9BACL|nr:hypothetical protein [Paenibacillus oceani]MBD2863621.1 hypothetical protein [Paenibacillus oceani]